jgi:hypothetical protein
MHHVRLTNCEFVRRQDPARFPCEFFRVVDYYPLPHGFLNAQSIASAQLEHNMQTPVALPLYRSSATHFPASSAVRAFQIFAFIL